MHVPLFSHMLVFTTMRVASLARVCLAQCSLVYPLDKYGEGIGGPVGAGDAGNGDSSPVDRPDAAEAGATFDGGLPEASIRCGSAPRSPPPTALDTQSA
jgi:hypothetical protein